MPASIPKENIPKESILKERVPEEMIPKKISDLYDAAALSGRPLFSFEFFPPKGSGDMERFYDTVSRLRELQPGFVSVTYGAGGSSQERTLECTAEIQSRYGITAMAHYTTVGNSRQGVQSYISALWERGIANIMALRGDLPQEQSRIEPSRIKQSQNAQSDSGQSHSRQSQSDLRRPDSPYPADGLRYSNELIAFIKSCNYDFCLGGACYPEGHPEAPSLDQDLQNLKKKVDAGASFLITQLFFLNDSFFRFRDSCQRIGIEVPIVPGIMPITSFRQIERFTKMTGCTFPKDLLRQIELCSEDRDRLLKVSLDFSLAQCRELLEQQAPGLHFYTLNQSHITTQILKALQSQGAAQGAVPGTVQEELLSN